MLCFPPQQEQFPLLWWQFCLFRCIFCQSFSICRGCYSSQLGCRILRNCKNYIGWLTWWVSNTNSARSLWDYWHRILQAFIAKKDLPPYLFLACFDFYEGYANPGMPWQRKRERLIFFMQCNKKKKHKVREATHSQCHRWSNLLWQVWSLETTGWEECNFLCIIYLCDSLSFCEIKSYTLMISLS